MRPMTSPPGPMPSQSSPPFWRHHVSPCIGLCDCGRLTVEASEVVMSEQHATLLEKARERLIEDRRAFAKIIAAPFEREKTVDARARFVELQATIEAIDRAIEDEEGGQGSV